MIKKSGLALIAATTALVTPAFAADVLIKLTGVQEGGDLYVALQTEEQFMKDDGAFGDIREAVTAGTQKFKFEDVPDGEYALMVWHDIDGDAVFDMSEYGMPIDGWAASNGTTLQGPPTFDVVKFTVAGEDVSLSEPMIYFNGGQPH